MLHAKTVCSQLFVFVLLCLNVNAFLLINTKLCVSKCVWAINTGRCLSEETTRCLFVNTFLNTAFINSVFVDVLI